MKSYLLTITPLVASILLALVISALSKNTDDSGRADRLSLWVSIAGLLLPAIFLITLVPGTRLFGGSLLVTGVGQTFLLVYLLLTALVLLLTHGYFVKIHVNGKDWRVIVLCMSLGAVHLTLANDLPTVFVAFQLVSIPTYALAGFTRIDRRSNEAGMKYLILGLVAGALLLLGISFLYGSSGAMDLDTIRAQLTVPPASIDASAPDAGAPTAAPSIRGLAQLALVLILIALFFKTAAAPFHSYLLDVYQGSSLAAMAIIAVPAKIAYFALIYRLLTGPFLDFGEIWRPLIAIVAVASFAFGALQGLAQSNLKRILACSSVLNTGFILLTLAFARPEIVIFYLFVYGVMTVALIAFWTYLGREYADLDSLGDLTGLARRDLPTAIGMTVVLLSFAGIPLTAGFFSKFFAVFAVFQDARAAANASLPAIVAALGVLGSLLAAYFYFNMIRTIWFRGEPLAIPAAAGADDRRWNYAFVAWLGVALLIGLGIYPFPLML